MGTERLGHIVDLLVDEIDSSRKPWHVRQVVRPRELDLLARAIADAGRVELPLTVRCSESGERPYEVVSGRRRLLAVARLGSQRVPARVVDIDDLEARLLLLREHMSPDDLKLLERSWSILETWQSLGCSKSELARQLGVVPSVVSEAVKIASFIPLAAIEEAAGGAAAMMVTDAVEALEQLGKRQLLSIANGMKHGDKSLLQAALQDRLSTGNPPQAAGLQERAGQKTHPARFVITISGDRAQLDVRVPIRELQPSEARAIVDSMNPWWRALRNHASPQSFTNSLRALFPGLSKKTSAVPSRAATSTQARKYQSQPSGGLVPAGTPELTSVVPISSLLTPRDSALSPGENPLSPKDSGFSPGDNGHSPGDNGLSSGEGVFPPRDGGGPLTVGVAPQVGGTATPATNCVVQTLAEPVGRSSHPGRRVFRVSRDCVALFVSALRRCRAWVGKLVARITTRRWGRIPMVQNEPRGES
jgi:ParB/RepB/Spo0J family partition protein